MWGGYVRCQRREKNLRLKHWRGWFKQGRRSLLVIMRENGLRNRLNIVFDATNLSCASLNKILHIFNNVKGEKVLHLYLFEISRKPEICKERCRIDIESKVDRADTASVDGLHEKMSEKYIKLVDSDEFSKLIKKERELPNTEVNIFKIDEFGIPELVG